MEKKGERRGHNKRRNERRKRKGGERRRYHPVISLTMSVNESSVEVERVRVNWTQQLVLILPLHLASSLLLSLPPSLLLRVSEVNARMYILVRVAGSFASLS